MHLRLTDNIVFQCLPIATKYLPNQPLFFFLLILSMASTIDDLPDALLSTIVASISDTRTRNSLSLVNRKFLMLERSTRSFLTLRGNVRDLLLIPTSFRSISHLDLSLLSPWGHSLFSSPYYDDRLLAHRLRTVFPSVNSLVVYVRSPSTLQNLASEWKEHLQHVKLVRWHQRPQLPFGADFAPLFEQCNFLSSLDLSNFYYWTEDLPPVLEAYPNVAASLTRLNLLTTSFSEGFKSHELRAITAVCPNLKQLLVACMFDPRYIGFVGDEALLAVAKNCPKLNLLHLADTSSLSNAWGNPDDDGFSLEDAGIDRLTLVELFSGLPLLEELVLDVGKNVRDSGFALEVLNSKCSNLKSVMLGQFHGITAATDSKLNGIALCQGLVSLSIKNSADLNNMGLIAIARGCSRLSKFEVHGCKNITSEGLGTLACLLRLTLTDVKISCCKNLNATSSLRALEPVCDRIERLHIDCVWDDTGEVEKECGTGHSFDLNELAELIVSNGNGNMDNLNGSVERGETSKRKRCKYSKDEDSSYMHRNGNGFWCKRWVRLHYLSLWIGVGELLTPLATAGLESCPNLEEICIRVEGDCRERHNPSTLPFGLSSLKRYPRLSKMKLDCGNTIGYALTAPPGLSDLSTWERFYMNGIGNLSLSELDYWPPQDREVNQRSLSLPAPGLLMQCATLRKLFIHGTACEHFMMFLLRIPNLRDVQLREDYYPAPENDMSTEMRVDSCSRFEDALNSQQIPD